jgi:hypothetical protein
MKWSIAVLFFSQNTREKKPDMIMTQILAEVYG